MSDGNWSGGDSPRIDSYSEVSSQSWFSRIGSGTRVVGSRLAYCFSWVHSSCSSGTRGGRCTRRGV